MEMSHFQEKYLGFCMAILLVLNLCFGKDANSHLVGYLECEHCTPDSVKARNPSPSVQTFPSPAVLQPSHVFDSNKQVIIGLSMTMDCRSKDGNKRTIRVGDADNEGNFIINFLEEAILKDCIQNDKCFLKLHSASGALCPLQKSKQTFVLVFKFTNTVMQTLAVTRRIRFSSRSYTAAFSWFNKNNHILSHSSGKSPKRQMDRFPTSQTTHREPFLHKTSLNKNLVEPPILVSRKLLTIPFPFSPPLFPPVPVVPNPSSSHSPVRNPPPTPSPTSIAPQTPHAPLSNSSSSSPPSPIYGKTIPPPLPSSKKPALALPPIYHAPGSDVSIPKKPHPPPLPPSPPIYKKMSPPPMHNVNNSPPPATPYSKEPSPPVAPSYLPPPVPSLKKSPLTPYIKKPSPPMVLSYKNPLPPPVPSFQKPPPMPYITKPSPPLAPSYKNLLPPPVPNFQKPPPLPYIKKPSPPLAPTYKNPLPPPTPNSKKTIPPMATPPMYIEPPLPPLAPIYKKPLPVPPPTPHFKKLLPPISPTPAYKKPSLPPLAPTYMKPNPPHINSPKPITNKHYPPPVPVSKISSPPTISPIPVKKPYITVTPPTSISPVSLPSPNPSHERPVPSTKSKAKPPPTAPPNISHSPIPRAPPIPKLPTIPKIPRRYFNIPRPGHQFPSPPTKLMFRYQLVPIAQ